jgi:transposase
MKQRTVRPTIRELQRQLAEMRQLVTSLKAELARVKAELAAERGERVPGSEPDEEHEATSAVSRPTPPRWVKANVVTIERKRPRKLRAPVPGRRRARPDRQVIHAPDQCPVCAHALRRGRVVRRRQVIVVPPVRAEVVEHIVLERRCGQCGTVATGTMPDLSAEVGDHRRISWEVAAQVAVLRTKLRLPVASVQWLVSHVWGLHLSEGAVCALLDDAASAGRDAYEGFLEEARASPVMHVDETGWRQQGRNGFVWTVSTPTLRRFDHTQSRAGVVARRLVGAEYEGVLVSDFYTAYDQLDGLHQRCWAHLLRDLHDLRTQDPDDTGLAAWAEAVHGLYQRAMAWTADAAPRAPRERQTARLSFERELLALCRAQPIGSRQTTLCKRVERYHPELFMFVEDPAVPSTNNAAERALRPLVIARKISGGTRSAKGTRTRMILQSLIATWEVRNQDPIAEMRRLLQAPREPIPKIATV